MAYPSYSRPRGPSRLSTNHTSPDLLGLLTPSGPARASPPSHTRTRSPLPGYTQTLHTYSAASPRSLRGSTSPPAPARGTPLPPTLEKAERRAQVERVVDDLIQRQMRAVRVKKGEEALVAREEPQSGIVVERLVREGADGRGATLVLCHANGMHKEMWEPTLRSVLGRTSARIDEMWLIDAVNHGDSAVLNEGKLGDVFSWHDHARDILQFLLLFLPQMFDAAPLPGRLEPNGHATEPGGLLDFSTIGPGSRRQVVGVGHSFGGCCHLLAAAAVPALYSSLILVDPVVRPACLDAPIDLDNLGPAKKVWPAALARGAVSRQDTWPSRQAAHASFLSKPFFAAWDPRVLQLYVSDGLRDIPTPSGGVALKTAGLDEALTFAEKSAHDAWEAVATLPPSLPVHFCMAGTTANTTSGEEATAAMVWRAPGSSNVRIPSAGHLIVQEKPDELGVAIADFLSMRYGERKAAL